MKKVIKILFFIFFVLPFVSFSQIENRDSRTFELNKKVMNKSTSDIERYKCIKSTGAFKGHGIFSVIKAKISFYKASKKARKYSNELYLGFGGTNTKKDAYRHAIWSALLARCFGSMTSINHRIEFAKAVGDANEVCGKNAKDGSQMDIHNNKIGRDLFKNNTEYRKFFKMTIGLKKPKVSELKIIVFELVEKAYFINGEKGVENTFEEIKKMDTSKLVFIKK